MLRKLSSNHSFDKHLRNNSNITADNGIFNSIEKEKIVNFVLQIDTFIEKYKSLTPRSKRSSSSGNFKPPNSSSKIIAKLENELKDVKKIIENLKTIPTVNNEDKSRFSTIEVKLETIQKQIDQHSKKSDDVNQSFYTDMKKFTDDISNFKQALKEVKQNNTDLTDECINDIRAHRFSAAKQKLPHLKDDFEINRIVKIVYDHRAGNFNLILDFGKSLQYDYTRKYLVYNALNYEMEANEHKDTSKIIKLMEETKTLLESDISDVKLKSQSLLNDLTKTITTEVIEVLKNDVYNNRFHAHQRLVNQIYDFDINVFNNIMDELINTGFGQMESNKLVKYLKSLEKTKDILPAILTLFEKIKNKDDLIVNDNTIVTLLELQTYTQDMLKLSENVNNSKLQHLKLELSNIKKQTVDIFEENLLNNRYSSNFIIADHVFNYNKKLFKDIITDLIQSSYEKLDVDKILTDISKHNYINQIIWGYEVIFNQMKKRGHIYSSNVNTIISVFTLKKLLNDLSKRSDFSEVSKEDKTKIESIRKQLPNTKITIKENYKNSIINRDYKSTKNLADKLFNSDEIVFKDIITEVVEELYGKIQTEILLEFFHNFTDVKQFLFGTSIVLNKIRRNDNLEVKENTVIAFYLLDSYIGEIIKTRKYGITVPLGIIIEFENLKLSLPNVDDIVKEKIKYAMINNQNYAVLKIADKIYSYNLDKFAKIIKDAIHDIYGKANTLNITKYIKNQKYLTQYLVAYTILLEKMSEKREKGNALNEIVKHISEIQRHPNYKQTNEYWRERCTLAKNIRYRRDLSFKSYDNSNKRKNKNISNDYSHVPYYESGKLTHIITNNNNDLHVIGSNKFTVNQGSSKYMPLINITPFINTVVNNKTAKINGEKYPLNSLENGIIDVGSTALLLDLFVRKISGEKYSASNEISLSFHEVQALALNITNDFENVLKKTADKFDVTMNDVDFYGLYLKVSDLLKKERYSEISSVLNSILTKVFPKIYKVDDFVPILQQAIDEILNKLDK